MAKIRGTHKNDKLNGHDGDDTIHGRGGHDHLNGKGGNDTLSGDDGNDTLVGGPGNDTLNGSGGADSMSGGADNDLYFVDNAGDVVNETAVGSSGIDRVVSTISHTLGAGVENLDLIGGDPTNGTGNILANLINGNASNNILNGGAGDDTLFGGAGNDTLIGGPGNNDLHPGLGNDTVNGTGGFASVDYAELMSRVTVDLSAGTTGGAAGVDTLVGILAAAGGSGNDTLTGGDATITMRGNGGNDRLFFGSSTSDQFQGDAGYDELYGDAFSTDGFRLQYDQGIDQFFNFDRAGGDYIQISKNELHIAGSSSASDFFVANTTGQASTADQRLIFETDTNILWADLDGTAAAFSALPLAIVQGVTLIGSDFF